MITRNFPPLMGGMERLIYHSYLEIFSHFNIVVVGPKGCENFIQSENITFQSFPAINFILTCHWSAFKAVKKFTPKLIISGSGTTVPTALIISRCLNIPVITFLHGLDIVADNLIYKLFFLSCIKKCDGFIVNSLNTKLLATQKGVSSKKIKVLHPGVTIPPSANIKEIQSFKKKYNIQNRPILLSVGRLTRRKGILEFIEKCMPQLVKAEPNLLLMIVGADAKQALKKSSSIKEKILKVLDDKNLSNNVIMTGTLNDLQLSLAFSSSNLLIFPVLNSPHDVEGFGMVAVEAAAHGIPTIAFASGGVPDAVMQNISGFLVPTGEYRQFYELILQVLKDKTFSQQQCIAFAEKFKWQIFGNKLRRICKEYFK